MESIGKRRRSASRAATGADNSLIADFLDLRESSMVQTGPKRPRQGSRELWLTPDPLTPLENIQHRQRRRSTTSRPKPTPSSLVASSKRASTGGKKSAKKPVKPTSPGEISTTSDESSSKQFAASSTTPLGHLQLEDQGHSEQSTSAGKDSSKFSLKSPSSTKSSVLAGSNNEPSQTGTFSSSLTPSEDLTGSQARSKSTSKKRTSNHKRKSANLNLPESSTSISAASDESPTQAEHAAVSGITPLEQLRRKSRKQSKRSSLGRKSTRKSTMKLRSSEIRGVARLPHMGASLAVSLCEPVHTSQGHTHPSHTPPPSSAGTDSEGSQSDHFPLQVEELPSQIEEQHSPTENEEDEMPVQTDGHEISPEMTEHDVSPSANELETSPLTGGNEISPLSEGAGAPTSANRHSIGSSAGPEQLKSVLKDADHVSSLKRRTRRNSRVSFGRYVTVAEYSPNHHRSRNRSLTVEKFPDVNIPLVDTDATSPPDIQEGLGEKDCSEDGGGGTGSDGAVESAESSSSPGELEPLGDEEDEMGGSGPGEEESTDEMETEELLEEVEQKRLSKHKKSTVVPRALTKKKRGKGKAQANTLSRALIKNYFMLFSKRRMTKDAMNLISKFTEVYLKQASSDIAAYTAHAGRKTIEIEDIVLLLKRQRFITENRPFEYLVNTYLPLEHAEELLPCAVAGKEIVPQMK